MLDDVGSSALVEEVTGAKVLETARVDEIGVDKMSEVEKLVEVSDTVEDAVDRTLDDPILEAGDSVLDKVDMSDAEVAEGFAVDEAVGNSTVEDVSESEVADGLTSVDELDSVNVDVGALELAAVLESLVVVAVEMAVVSDSELTSLLIVVET